MIPDALYNFSHIPATLLHLLGVGEGGLPQDCTRGGPYQRVVCILIDGFGWRFLHEWAAQSPLLQRFFERGIVSKLSSQFPSTTAAHMTTLCSGLPVGTHGIYEWFIYEPSLRRIVAPLPYAFAGDKEGETLRPYLQPEMFLPRPHIFEQLHRAQVPAHIFQHTSIAHSTYSRWMYGSAQSLGYTSWPEGLHKLRSTLNNQGLFYLYFGEFDAMAHRHGLSSTKTRQALHHCLEHLEQAISTIPELSEPSTALILTADHGMHEIDPATTLYFNERFPHLERHLERGANERPLAPAGSCRDFFLHVNPSALEDVRQELSESLQGKATVLLTSTLTEEGLFEPTSEKCRQRMGNLVILPSDHNSIWWREKGRFEQKFYAMHGGLTTDELEIPFLFYSAES